MDRRGRGGKGRVVETAAEFFKKGAGNAQGDGLMKFLRNSPRIAPEPGDDVG